MDYKRDEQLEQALEQREVFRKKTFYMMFEMAFIIAIPAIIAAIAGKKIDAGHGGGHTYTLLFLVGSFIFSWFLIIMRYLQITKQGENIDKKIKQLKK